MKLWAFNRRVLSDQTVWVEGNTLAEAKENFAAENIVVAEDHYVISMTTRRQPEKDTEK